MSRNEEGKKILFLSPLTGRSVSLEEVPDPVFSQKIIGDGMAVIPSDGRIVSPVDAQVVSVADTAHAYGLKTEDGIELLIHAGIDTVKMNGEGFETFVETGAKVKKGDKLLSFDMDLVKEKGYKTQTMFLVADAKGKEVEVVEVADADNNTKIMNLK